MSLSSARRRVAPLLATGLAALLVASGCSAGGDDADADATPAPLPGSVDDLDPATIQVPRIDFCELVPEDVVTTALAGDVRRDAARATDLPVQETGCTWRGEDAVARAWIYSRPVSTDQAVTYAARANDRDGCRTEQGTVYAGAGFHQVCRVGDGRVRDRWAGLFGDTWLTCELEGARGPELTSRADAWCAQLAASLDAAG